MGIGFDQAYPSIRKFLDNLLAECGTDLHGLRNRAILLIAYESTMRRSELVALRESLGSTNTWLGRRIFKSKLLRESVATLCGLELRMICSTMERARLKSWSKGVGLRLIT